MVDLDTETLFNGAAAAVSTIAVLIFTFNVDLGHSPVSKALLVLAFLAVVFAVTQRTDEPQLTLLGYGVIVVSGVALFFHAVSTFGAGDTATVVGLLAIAGVLFFLRTALDEESRFVTGRRATYGAAAVTVLAAVVLLVDVATGGLAYELRPESEIEYPGPRTDDDARIATLVVTNPTPLPERVDAPEYRACTAGNWSTYRIAGEPGEPPRPVDVHVSVEDGYNEHVVGFGAKRYPVVLHLHGEGLGGEAFPVEVTDACPDDETGSPYVALFEAPERRFGARPV